MKKNIFKISIVILLLVLYIYIANITLLPEKLVMLQGETLKFRMAWGLQLEEIETSQQASKSEEKSLEKTGVTDYQICIGNMKLKEVSATVVPKTKVIPLGNAIGLKLYTSGVLVVGMSEIEGKKPYVGSGIEEGDRIVKIDNEEITCTDDLIETVNRSKGEQVTVKYIQNENEKETTIKPAKTKEDEYKLGLWVRDAAAGVGTATFYIPETGEVAALRTSVFLILIQNN